MARKQPARRSPDLIADTDAAADRNTARAVAFRMSRRAQRRTTKGRLLKGPWRELVVTLDERALARRALVHEEDAYRQTQNPLRAWDAYLDARSAGLIPPAWVLAYLDRVARRFATWTRDPRLCPKKPGPAIVAALEMKARPTGRGNIFLDRFKHTARDVALSMAVSDALNDDRRTHGFAKHTRAVEDVAKAEGVTASMVRRAWKRFRPDDE